VLEKTLQNNQDFKNLCKVLTELNNKDDVANFLRDSLTYKEVKGMAERLATAKLLEKGFSYREIQDKTGISTTTVTRVAQWLHHGCNGYDKALKLLK